jgi:hypothetical protein
MKKNVQSKTERDFFQNRNGRSSVEGVVMARVHRVHFMRTLSSPTALKLYSSALLYFMLISMVSTANVYANMPSLMTPKELLIFILSAVLNTEIAVQCVLAFFVGVVAFFVRDMARTLKESKVYLTRVQV